VTPADDAGIGVAINEPLGQVLVRRGLVNEEQVQEAVALQSALAARGVFLRLGELLVARGLVDEAGIEEVLRLQGTEILVCRGCLAQFNVQGYEKDETYTCRRCHETLAKPDAVQELSVEDTLVSGISLIEPDVEERRFGPYTILGQISRGGMGIIYKARQLDLDRIVAMKVLAGEGGDVLALREAFQSEARAVASLRHPYIIPIHEVGRIEGVDYFTMQYIEGQPIHRGVASEGLDTREIVDVFLHVCDAVEFSHSEGLLHRDIKPENILLDQKRRPVLIDFGIARGLDEAEASDSILGSPAYLPPEYVAGAEYDQASEVYALGATLYTLLAGRPPRSGVDTVAVLKDVAALEPVKPIRQVRRTLDRALAQIVMTALAVDPANRYPTVRDLATDLVRWQEGDEIAAAASPLARAWARVRPRVAATLGLAVALILPLLTGFLTWQRNQVERRLQETEDNAARERAQFLSELATIRLDLAQSCLLSGDSARAEKLLARVRVQGELSPALQERLRVLEAKLPK
jgi:predicted Ser/Thr protein kinase